MSIRKLACRPALLLSALLASALLCACSSGGAKSATPIAKRTDVSSVLFRSGQISAWQIKDASGAVVGRVHSTYTRGDDGFQQVVTRLKLGDGLAVEHATTFRDDLSPVRYKRLSSTAGRYALEFRGDTLRIFEGQGADEIPFKDVRVVVVPQDDPMMLAVALHGERLGAGSSVKMDVFSPEARSSAPWSVSAHTDASKRLVAELPNGRAVLTADGHVERLELTERGLVFEPQVPPQAPPAVKYAPPLAYERPTTANWRDVDASIDVKDGKLVGVLSMPMHRARWPQGLAPAVVLLSDEGPHDRHGFQGSTDYGTWEIIDHVAHLGFATLRLDDRGVGASESSAGDELAGIGLDTADALRVVGWLQKQRDIDPQKIVLVGHGRGCFAAIAVAKRLALGGLALISPPYRAAPERFDIDAALAGVEEPVSVFIGMKDFQVSWREDAQPLVEVLKKNGGRRRTKLFAYEDVDHLMKNEPRTSSYDRYADRSRKVERRFLEDLAKWLEAR